MSNYRPMPSDELKEAIEWLREEVRRSGTDEERTYAYTLINELNELIRVWNLWYLNECYRDVTYERNALAKRMYARRFHEEPWNLLGGEGDYPRRMAQRCLSLADTFLEISGEKVKANEDIERRLREVLGWVKP